MTPELTALTLAALLQCIQFALMAIPANMELGTGKTASPRDLDRLGKPMVELLSVKTARLTRAMNNHFEALILFGIAITVISLSDKTTAFTTACAYTYLGARVLYIPAYYFGWTPWRSLIWFVGFLATIFILIAALM
ncbi:MAG: MAPEG family protein [Yoonia sp.]|nr:MAPEG family protein [Yoonia sp.]